MFFGCFNNKTIKHSRTSSEENMTQRHTLARDLPCFHMARVHFKMTILLHTNETKTENNAQKQINRTQLSPAKAPSTSVYVSMAFIKIYSALVLIQIYSNLTN